MTSDGDAWFDEDAGRLVRPYGVTRGRARPSTSRTDLVSQVVAVTPGPDLYKAPIEHRDVLRLCERPLSVAELGALLDIPAPAVRVLLDELLDLGAIVVRRPDVSIRLPDRQVLAAVIKRLRDL